MIVHQLNHDGCLVASYPADESPLEPGVYLIPAGCIEAPPPAYGARECARWTGSEWEVIPDWRGWTGYTADGEPVTITDVGIEPDVTWATTLPAAAQLALDMAALRAERDRRLSAALAILDRHRNQRDFGLPTSLTEEEAHAWAVYAQMLRDLPENTADPAAPDWPEIPA